MIKNKKILGKSRKQCVNKMEISIENLKGN